MRRWPLAVAAAPLLLCRRWFGEVRSGTGTARGGGQILDSSPSAKIFSILVNDRADRRNWRSWISNVSNDRRKNKEQITYES